MLTHQTTSRSDSSTDEPLRAAIRALTAAARADFGTRFTRQFDAAADPDAVSLDRWCYRMLHRVSGVPGICPGAIIDGYEDAKDAAYPHMPSLEDFVRAIRARASAAKRVADDLARANAPRLPKGSGLAGCVDYLAAEAEGNVAQGCIAMMREILARPPAANRADAAERLDRAVKAHDTLLAMAPAIPRAYGERRECGHTGCTRPGTMSHATNGEGPWYCSEHWRS